MFMTVRLWEFTVFTSLFFNRDFVRDLTARAV